MDRDDPIYQAARSAYENGSETVRGIARRLGIPERRIFQWRRRHQWPARRIDIAETDGHIPITRRQRRGYATVSRVWHAIDAALTRLETAMTTGDPPTTADCEREARAIGALVRNLGKATELEKDAGAGAPSTTADAPASARVDPDELRRALAERLGRLRRQLTGDDPGSDPGPRG
jgi:transposase-like protein